MLLSSQEFSPSFEKNAGVTCPSCGERSDFSFGAKVAVQLLGAASACSLLLALILAMPLIDPEFGALGVSIVIFSVIAFGVLSMYGLGYVAKSLFPLRRKEPSPPG